MTRYHDPALLLDRTKNLIDRLKRWDHCTKIRYVDQKEAETIKAMRIGAVPAVARWKALDLTTSMIRTAAEIDRLGARVLTLDDLTVSACWDVFVCSRFCVVSDPDETGLGRIHWIRPQLFGLKTLKLAIERWPKT